MWTLILFIISVEAAAEADDVEVVKVMEGSLLKLSAEVEQLKGNIQILWTFESGKQSSRLAQYHGKTYTHYDDRFSGRVELDERTGALNILNISTHDSGLYKALIVINKQISTRKYKVDVYAPVSVPEIKSSSKKSVQHPTSEFCWVVCSVRNDRDVFISWYKEDVKVNQSSSFDLSINLSLPLKLHHNAPESYICTAVNPVSNKSITLYIKDVCPHNAECVQHCGDVEVLIRLILSVLVGIATVVFLLEHLKSTQNTSSDEEMCMRHQRT